MGTCASLVVATMPPRRAVGALRRATAAAAAISERPDVTFVRAVQGSRFRPRVAPPYLPGRVGVMTWAPSLEVLAACDREVLDRFDGAAHEVWQVTLQPVSVHGDWFGFVPDVQDAAPLTPDEPTVVLINGVLKTRHLLRFLRDNARSVRQLGTAAGYLGGLGISDTPMTTTSVSCWRSPRDSRAFAFGPGAHQHAYQIDLAQERHRTMFWVRFRPLATAGTLDGRNPFEGVTLRGLATSRHHADHGS